MATTAPSAAPAPPREAIEVEVTGATPDRSHSDTTPFAGDQTPAPSAPAEAVSSEPAPEPASKPCVEKAEAEAPSSGTTIPSPAIEEEKVASAAETVTPAFEPVTPVVEPSEAPKPIETAETAQVEETPPATPQMTQADTPVAPAPVAASEPEAPSASKLAEPDSTSQSTQIAEADSTSPATQTAEVDTPPSTQTARAGPLLRACRFRRENPNPPPM